jgi:hypothetical protein
MTTTPRGKETKYRATRKYTVPEKKNVIGFEATHMNEGRMQ